MTGMNGTLSEAAKPRRIELTWFAQEGFYILAADRVSRSFIDPDDVVAAIRAAIDPRLDVKPKWNC